MNTKHSPSSVPSGAERNKPARHLTTPNFILICFLAIIGFFLAMEHRAHLYGILPWLILAACPLMHIFMHHGHGGHGHDSKEE